MKNLSVRPRHPFFLWSSVIFLTLTACKSMSDGSATLSHDGGKQKDVNITAQYELRVREASALAQCVLETNKDSVLLVAGDHDFDLDVVRGSGKWDKISEETIDLSSVLSKNEVKSKEGSQWEAVSCDNRGHVFILKEKDSVISVFDSKLKNVVQRITLDYDKEVPEGWKDEENSRGEGMVLLRNGHILIAKEKKPALLVEFGPKGDKALGVSAQTFLPPGQAFALRSGSSTRYTALKTWPLSSKAAEKIGDMSELAVDGRGNLYALGQENRGLFRLAIRSDCSKDNSTKDERVCVIAEWSLPEKIIYPEGLVFWNGTLPLIASDDADTSKKALFVLEPLQN